MCLVSKLRVSRGRNFDAYELCVLYGLRDEPPFLVFQVAFGAALAGGFTYVSEEQKCHSVSYSKQEQKEDSGSLARTLCRKVTTVPSFNLALQFLSNFDLFSSCPLAPTLCSFLSDKPTSDYASCFLARFCRDILQNTRVLSDLWRAKWTENELEMLSFMGLPARLLQQELTTHA